MEKTTIFAGYISCLKRKITILFKLARHNSPCMTGTCWPPQDTLCGKLYPCRPQPVQSLLPFKIIYTVILCRVFVSALALRDFKTRTILVNRIFISKRGLTFVVAYMGTLVFPVFLNLSFQYSWLP